MVALVASAVIIWFVAVDMRHDVDGDFTFMVPSDAVLERASTASERSVQFNQTSFPVIHGIDTIEARLERLEALNAMTTPNAPTHKTRSSAAPSLIKLPEARADTLLAATTSAQADTLRTRRRSPHRSLPGTTSVPVRGDAQPVLSHAVPVTLAAAAAMRSAPDSGLFTLNLSGGPVEVPELMLPSETKTASSARKSGAPVFASDSAFANSYGTPLDVDDLFTLKLHAMYGTSKANFEDPTLGSFRDRFLVLGGDKKIDFAGMDTMNLNLDGVITTSGTWDTDTLRQNLSGFTLNAGPEFKLPELPLKFETNVGVGWLTREAALLDGHGDPAAYADIDSFVYGGGAALRGDWQWRMLKISGMAGVQYAGGSDKAHTYRTREGDDYPDHNYEKKKYSSWEVPLQLRASGEYRLLNALTVTPSLWGGYTYNVTGKNGPFQSGHLAGAEGTWRRNGITWNRSHWHVGGEARFKIVDRIDL
ncbi:MAG: hypothetical protein LIQ31_16475 [Planctomycetes bacterium]|nr:hypothetical protein [Planctomycetota bacterium]